MLLHLLGLPEAVQVFSVFPVSVQSLEHVSCVSYTPRTSSTGLAAIQDVLQMINQSIQLAG